MASGEQNLGPTPTLKLPKPEETHDPAKLAAWIKANVKPYAGIADNLALKTDTVTAEELTTEQILKEIVSRRKVGATDEQIAEFLRQNAEEGFDPTFETISDPTRLGQLSSVTVGWILQQHPFEPKRIKALESPSQKNWSAALRALKYLHEYIKPFSRDIRALQEALTLVKEGRSIPLRVAGEVDLFRVLQLVESEREARASDVEAIRTQHPDRYLEIINEHGEKRRLMHQQALLDPTKGLAVHAMEALANEVQNPLSEAYRYAELGPIRFKRYDQIGTNQASTTLSAFRRGRENLDLTRAALDIAARGGKVKTNDRGWFDLSTLRKP